MAWADTLSGLDKSVYKTFKMPAVYTPKSGGQMFVEVNLRRKDAEVDNGNGGTIFTEMTEAVFSNCDMSGIARGDKFTCRGDEYIVTDIFDKTPDTVTVFVEKQ